MVFEHQAEHPSQWAAISSIALKIGCTSETLRKWVRQAEVCLSEGVASAARREGEVLLPRNAPLVRGLRPPSQAAGRCPQSDSNSDRGYTVSYYSTRVCRKCRDTRTRMKVTNGGSTHWRTGTS